MKLGALETLATDTDLPARMTVINMDTDVPLEASDGQECWIEFLSDDSEVGRKIARARGVAQMRKLRSGRNRRDDDEDLVEMQVETLSALATGWYFGPDAEAFSREAARKLFADPKYAWLRRQAFTFVNDAANFLARSSKTSGDSPSTPSAKAGS